MRSYENEQDFFNKFSMIVSSSENGVIGKKNNLLWYLPNDLKRFRELTTNKIIIMGKNTYLSLPQALPNRINVVISNDEKFLKREEKLEHSHTGIIKLKTIFDVFNFIYDFEVKKSENHEICSLFDINEFFIIGGSSIYKAFLPFIKKLYLTTVHTNIEGDVYLPDLKNYIWKIKEKTKMKSDTIHLYDYTFTTFEKINIPNDK